MTCRRACPSAPAGTSTRSSEGTELKVYRGTKEKAVARTHHAPLRSHHIRAAVERSEIWIEQDGNARLTDSVVQQRDRYRERFAAAMASAGVDVLVCPPCSVPAFRHGTTRELGPASVSYTCLYNLLVYPAGVVSVTQVREDETSSRSRGRDKIFDTARTVDAGSAGLPVGVQVVASPNREDRVLAVMAALERQRARSATSM